MAHGIGAVVDYFSFRRAKLDDSAVQLRTAIRRSKAAIVSPLRNIATGYVATVSVGTPPQPLRLLMDTGSANVFFGGPGCHGCGSLFRPTDSGSFRPRGGFNMFDWCTGALGADSVSLCPGAVIQKQAFGLCNKSDILQPPDGSSSSSWYDGLFGLGMRLLEQDSADIVPPLTNLRQQGLIERELFSVYLDHSDEPKGEIQWGFFDETRFTG